MAVALLVALVPAPVLACPVCGLAGVKDNAAAYGIMSVILSLLPLAMIAAVAVWFVRRVRQAERAPLRASSGPLPKQL